ncbi:hypothetical protein FB451DRAFT_396627 [Mycena latifolia]|nr:hypothetical protein FB451DRAFT_396627 [Mycena latifolia]
MKGYQDELKSLKGIPARSINTKSTRKSRDDTVIISASSCGRVKTVPIPRSATEITQAATVAPMLPPNPAAGIDISEAPSALKTVPVHEQGAVTSWDTPASSNHPIPLSQSSEFLPAPSYAPMFDLADFGLIQFSGQFDHTISDTAGSDFDFDMSMFECDPTTTGAPEFLGDSGSQFSLDWSVFMPLANPSAVPPPAPFAWGSESPGLQWASHSPPKELPLLPPPPPSSPLSAEPEGPLVVDSADSESPIAPHDIDLDLSEKNIIKGKRPRTLSTRASDAAASKKPRSRR